MGAVPHQVRDHGYAWSVSPDGTSIAFTTNPGPVGDREIWLMWPDGEHAKKLVETDNSGFQRVQWSPDGHRLAYVKRAQAGQRRVSIVSQDLKDGLSTTTVSQPGLEDFLWLPDGRMIYSIAEAPPNQEICNYWQLRIDPKSGEPIEKPRRLTNETRACLTTASVTADGKRLAFRKFSSERSVDVADLDSSGTRISHPRRLTMNDGEYAPTAWGADSRTVIFWSGSNGQSGIFKQSLDRDTAEPL